MLWLITSQNFLRLLLPFICKLNSYYLRIQQFFTNGNYFYSLKMYTSCWLLEFFIVNALCKISPVFSLLKRKYTEYFLSLKRVCMTSIILTIERSIYTLLRNITWIFCMESNMYLPWRRQISFKLIH